MSTLWRELKALVWPVGWYWVSILLGLITFTATVLFWEGGDADDISILGGMWIGALGGVAFGQLISLTRLRAAFFLPFAFTLVIVILYVIGTYEGVLKAAMGDATSTAILMGALLAVLVSPTGFWSLRNNRALAAIWGPALLFTSSIIIISEKTNTDDAWHQGMKHAIWQGATVPILAMAVITLLAFLATRESYRLHRWQTAPGGPLHSDTPEAQSARRPMAGCGSLLTLTVLACVLVVDSGVVAPYLWRTGPGDDDGWEAPPDPGEEPEEEEDEEGDNPFDMGELGEQLVQAAQQAGRAMCALLTLVVLALAVLLIFGPPLRRQLLLQHLRDPMWPVPPTQRVRLHWRLTEVALADAGVTRLPGESAEDLARRAAGQLPFLNLEPMHAAAAVADRVAYGYGMAPGDADLARRAAEMTYQMVWETLGEQQRLAATYRWI